MQCSCKQKVATIHKLPYQLAPIAMVYIKCIKKGRISLKYLSTQSLEKLCIRYLLLSLKLLKRNRIGDKCVPRIYGERFIQRPSTKIQTQTKTGPILLKARFCTGGLYISNTEMKTVVSQVFKKSYLENFHTIFSPFLLNWNQLITSVSLNLFSRHLCEIKPERISSLMWLRFVEPTRGHRTKKQQMTETVIPSRCGWEQSWLCPAAAAVCGSCSRALLHHYDSCKGVNIMSVRHVMSRLRKQLTLPVLLSLMKRGLSVLLVLPHFCLFELQSCEED